MDYTTAVIVGAIGLLVVAGLIWAFTSSSKPKSPVGTRTTRTTPSPTPSTPTPSTPEPTTPPCGTTVARTLTNNPMGASRSNGIVTVGTAYLHGANVGDCIQIELPWNPTLNTPPNSAARVLSVRTGWELTYALPGPDVAYQEAPAWQYGTLRIMRA